MPGSTQSAPAAIAPLSGRRAQWTWLLAALAILGLAAVLRVDDGQHVSLPLVGQSLPALCMWRVLLGQPCPGCGMTRAFISLAHGQWQAAWTYHPVGSVLFAFVAAQVPYRVWQLRRIHRGQQAWPFPPLAIAIAATILGAAMYGRWIMQFLAG